MMPLSVRAGRAQSSPRSLQVCEHDVAAPTAAELERARRELAASLDLARPGSQVCVPIQARLSAIDAELAGRRRACGGVLAEALLAGVHQHGDLGEVGAAFGVGDRGDAGTRGPRRGWERDQGARPVADAGVDDGRDVAGASEISFGDRVGEGLGGVQAGEFGGVQGPPQPPVPGPGPGVVAGRQGGRK
jgi:hypothetical protein